MITNTIIRFIFPLQVFEICRAQSLKAMSQAFLCLFILCSSSISAQLTIQDSKYIDSVMCMEYPSDLPGAVLLVSQNGKIQFRKAYGLADVESHVQTTPENLYDIGSMSKQFTAICILQLAEQGKLNLSDEVVKFVPEFSLNQKVSVEQLLTHTNGIRDFDENSHSGQKNSFDRTKNYSQRELLAFISGDSLLFKPGSQFTYSNSAYFLLAMIIEKVSGLTYNAYVSKHVFQKAGMAHSTFEGISTAIPNKAKPYYVQADSKIQEAEKISWVANVGCGNIVSCVDDLLKWDEALYGNILVGQKWLNRAFTSFHTTDGKKTDYGYGWGVGKFEGMPYSTHDGKVPGFLSAGIRFPSSHVCMYMLSNFGNSHMKAVENKIALKIMEKYLPIPGRYHPSTTDLQDASGVYKITRIGVRSVSAFTNRILYETVSVNQDSLFHQIPEGSREFLMPVKKDFFVSPSGKYYCFNRNKQQQVYQVTSTDLPINLGPPSERPKVQILSPLNRTVVKLSNEQISKVLGAYSLGVDGKFMFFREENKLLLKWDNDTPVEVFALNESTFMTKAMLFDFEFLHQTNGVYTDIVVRGMRDHFGKRE
jgi:CubicO group peptidase (beta-lactamase class C family)